jgi:4'-phosphopantetheinyl transferase
MIDNSLSLPPIDGTTALVVIVSFDQLAPQFAANFALLNKDERTRAQRFHFERDRRRYIFTRAHLRQVLGHYLNAPPGDIQFDYTSYGKPFLAEKHNTSLQFNVSHAGQYALIALTRSTPVGIDIEQADRRLDYIDMAQRFFSANEYSTLLGLPADQQRTAFFHCWTRKEAYIKALGQGLSIPLDSFEVSLNSEAQAAIIHINNNAQHDWILYNIAVPPPYCAALTTRKSIQAVTVVQPVID